MNWFIDKPEMLQDELDRLAAIGAEYIVDENAKSIGRIVLTVKYKICDDKLDFVCTYPAEYPYFPPIITCDNFPPGRHLEPSGKSLCTFADKDNTWNISHDTLAGLLKNQITDIYQIHKDPAVISVHEDKLEGYQPSGQLLAEPNSVILVTSDFKPDESIGRGYIQSCSIKDGKSEPIRACFSQIFNNEGILLFQDETDFSKCFSFNSKLPVRWCKLSEPLSCTNPDGIFRQVITEFPELKNPSRFNFGKIEVDIIAVCFLEESNRGEQEYNWLFLVRRSFKRNRETFEKLSIIRSDHLHPKYLLARTPSLIGLAGKTVTIVGLGALGSQVAFQLARAGVKRFNFIDKDYLQIGNLQRWLFGLPYIGISKVNAVATYLHSGYTGLTIQSFNFDIGCNQTISLRAGEEVLLSEFLRDEIVQKSDLVIDCSAMLNINQYLSMLCKSNKVDFVWCSATNGAWGGIIGRSPAHYSKDVWLDFNQKYGEKQIPEVASEPSGFVQPKGCFHPTFTGTGFDLDTISNMASRLSVSMLQGSKYGQFDDDVFVVEQWNDGSPIAPKWKGFKFNDG